MKQEQDPNDVVAFTKVLGDDLRVAMRPALPSWRSITTIIVCRATANLSLNLKGLHAWEWIRLATKPAANDGNDKTANCGGQNAAAFHCTSLEIEGKKFPRRAPLVLPAGRCVDDEPTSECATKAKQYYRG
jgi:hypothetical protein